MLPLLYPCPSLNDVRVDWVRLCEDPNPCDDSILESLLDSPDPVFVDITGTGEIDGFIVTQGNITIASSDDTRIVGRVTVTGIPQAVQLSLCGVALEAAFGPDAVWNFGGRLQLADVAVSGGMWVEGPTSELWATNSVFAGGRGLEGGAIRASLGGQITLVGDNELQNNEATWGGAIYLDGAHLSVLPVWVGEELERTTFTDNLADNLDLARRKGGAIYATGGSTMVIEGARFELVSQVGNSSAANFGGAIALDLGSHLTLIGGEIADMWVLERGGAIYASDAVVDVRGTLFERNGAAVSGGAIAVQQQTGASVLTVSDARFYGGANLEEVDAPDGGAIWTEDAALVTISHSEFCGTSAEHGGAIYLDCADGAVCSVDHVLSGRTWAEEGAFLFVEARDAELDNLTLVGIDGETDSVVEIDVQNIAWRASLVEAPGAEDLLHGNGAAELSWIDAVGTSFDQDDDVTLIDARIVDAIDWMPNTPDIERFECTGTEIRPSPWGSQFGRVEPPTGRSELGALADGVPNRGVPVSTGGPASPQGPLWLALGDEDGDGVQWRYDCNDGDPRVGADLPEICGDGLDNDCDGQLDAGDPDCTPDEQLIVDVTSIRWSGGCGGCHHAPHMGILFPMFALIGRSRRRSR